MKSFDGGFVWDGLDRADPESDVTSGALVQLHFSMILCFYLQLALIVLNTSQVLKVGSWACMFVGSQIKRLCWAFKLPQ